MKLDNGTYCPLVKGPCKKLDCMWFMKVQGLHPQTGEAIDEWDCAVKWQVLLQIENTRVTLGTQAATESMRNEIVTRMDNPLPIPLDPSRMIEVRR